MKRLRYLIRMNVRNLFIYKRFAFINIFGLSVGLIMSLLILLYIRYESSFDSFNPNAGNIYRVVGKNIQTGSVVASTPLPLSDVLKKDYPEIDKVTGLNRIWNDIKVGQERFENLKGAVVEKEFFEIFNFPLKSGNPGTIFQDPFEAVITDKFANILFGKNNPMGKTFEYEKTVFTVTGIINTIPSNSIFDFDYFLSDKFRHYYYPDLSERWYNSGLFTFVTFKGNKVPVGFELKLANIEKQYYPDFMKNRHKYLLADFKGSHLNPTLTGDMVPVVSPVYLWILSAIAIGILLIACLNFMNISIANAGKRNMETGIRKVYGASSRILIGDFFSEITFLVFISLIISFIGVLLLLPYFNNLIEKRIIIDFSDPFFWGGIIGFGLLTAIISGLYPSIVLSRPSPVKALLQKKGGLRNKLTFQKSFVVLQFVISIILGITQLFIMKQISFMQNHEGGFAKKNLIAISARSNGSSGAERMKNAAIFVQTLEQYQAQYGYGKAAVTEFVPGFGFNNLFKIYPEGNNYTDGLEVLSCDIDENFIDVFGLNMVQGRFFSKGFSTDKDALIINESAFKKLGWDSVEGKSLGLFSKDNKKEIVGVINDINIKSLQKSIEPMIYQFGRHHGFPGYITLRLDPNKTAESIEFIKKEWTRLFPEVPFVYEGVEEKFKASYGAEEKFARITGVFSILAMLLSLLGIFALSTLESDLRIKEIGIRRVNGAKVFEVMTLLNKDFLKWVGIAFVISVPIAWLIIHRWLENFAYRTNLSWWIFASVGLMALAVALLTVSWQSWRTATQNPVESLRNE
jgi:putative ABC transport system permease protein